jgi:hypothetical protein
MENLEKAYSIAEQALADSKGQSVAELASMRAARQWVAILFEQMNQLPAARKSAEQYMDLADRLVAVDNSPANLDSQSGARARLFRLMELTGATDAEFQQRSGSSARLTQERKQRFLAYGWQLAITDSPLDPRKGVPAGQRAVDGYRALVREGGPASQKIDLAVALHALATQHQMLARFAASPAEQVTHMENARRAIQESVDLLETVRTAGKLPEANRAAWSSMKTLLASMESKLAAARAATTAKR